MVYLKVFHPEKATSLDISLTGLKIPWIVGIVAHFDALLKVSTP